ncbi:MAG: BlaI/MecI/CopY family transcriptional regulator [Lachnospiraceae bacterium]|nr:BlaI/MecI/CopY family transcriptional regulator [Lachnospiraceae bacterium]
MGEIHLSNGEWKLMSFLWESSPLTIKEMVKLCEGDTDWNKNTIFIMLKRLKEKGAVSIDTSGKSQLYSACIDKDSVVMEETKNFLKKVYDGSVGMMVASMAGQKALSREDIDELYGFLRTLREGKEEK